MWKIIITADVTANTPHQIAIIIDVAFNNFFFIINPMDANKRINAQIIHNITQSFVIHGKIVI